MMISHKGQITPIIIVAIVLVIGFGVYFMIPGSDNVEKVDPSVEPIYNFVQGCLEEAANDAVLGVSRHGGYLNVPEENINNFPYYFKNGRNLMPSTDVIGSELSQFVAVAVSFCVQDFEEFPTFEVSENEIDVKTVISDRRVDFSVEFPLTVEKGEKIFEIEDFRYSVDARLGEMINLADFLVRDQLDHPISLCLSCGYYINNEYEMSYNNLNLGEGNFLHSISDSKIKIDNEPLEFNFVMELEVDG